MFLVLPQRPRQKNKDKHPLNLWKTLIVCGSLDSLGNICFFKANPSCFRSWQLEQHVGVWHFFLLQLMLNIKSGPQRFNAILIHLCLNKNIFMRYGQVTINFYHFQLGKTHQHNRILPSSVYSLLEIEHYGSQFSKKIFMCLCDFSIVNPLV